MALLPAPPGPQQNGLFHRFVHIGVFLARRCRKDGEAIEVRDRGQHTEYGRFPPFIHRKTGATHKLRV